MKIHHAVALMGLLMAGCASGAEDRPLPEGPPVVVKETVPLDNSRCPACDQSVAPEGRFEYNGYWVESCGTSCQAAFRKAPGAGARSLLQQTGVWVLPVDSDEPASEEAAEGSPQESPKDQ